MLFDQLSELSFKITDGEQDFPESKEAVAQYLLVFFGDEKYRVPYLNDDETKLAILVQLSFDGSVDYRRFQKAVAEFSKQVGISFEPTSRIHAYWNIGDRIVLDNLASLALGCLLIFLCFARLLRSGWLGLISVIPNIIPVTSGLAFIALLGIPLDIGTSIIFAIALGLVVDDTGHFLTNYDLKRRFGLLAEAAARETLRELWQPILTTTLVVIVGFSVMYFAPLTPFISFAAALSFIMLLALICDLILLPSLLVACDKRRFVRVKSQFRTN
jgi:predicted RND superfamily exporter protein